MGNRRRYQMSTSNRQNNYRRVSRTARISASRHDETMDRLRILGCRRNLYGLSRGPDCSLRSTSGAAMKTFHIARMYRGWFIGDFDPSVVRTHAAEVAYKTYET